MPNKRIIFLDFDGVIDGWWSKYNLDPKKIALVEEIIKATDDKIVVSSSWSVGCRNAEEFIERDFSEYFKRKNTEISRKSLFIESIIDVTDHMGSSRGDEIQRWLDAHEDEVESYVILDDDNDMNEDQFFNFISVDGCYGISDRIVNLAIQILKNEKVINPIRLNTELMFRWRLKCNGLTSNIETLLMDYNNKMLIK